jgi:FtsK/SpoIIIE family
MTDQPISMEPGRLATVTMLPTARPADPEAVTLVLDSARRVLAGGPATPPATPPATGPTVIPTAVEKADDDDWAGDTPLIPAWAHSLEGWAAWAGRVARSRRRAARRWARRQRTDRGHLAQARRGARRLHDWVVGLEGVQMESLHHAAQIAARQARDANRRARFTPRILPTKHKAATDAAVRATAAAETATAAYRRARRERRRARQMRAAVVYGPPLVAVTAGYATEGVLGMAAAVLATFAGTAFAGRHAPSEETDWEGEWRSLGDGDPMTAPMLDSVFRAARVIGAEESLRVVRMPMIDTRGAWSATLDLPPGIPAKKALSSIDALASALGVEAAQVSITKVGRAGRIELYVTRELPFTERAGRGPLLDSEGAANFWDRVSIGPDVRGTAISISVVERSGLIGGEPGAGKSASGNTILLAAALDPRVILWLADGKGGGDLEPFSGLCERFEGDADPEAFNAMLNDALLDMSARYALLKRLGKRKVTEELADKHPELRQKLLWVDELMFYTTDEDYGKKITKKLRNLVSRGRAAGIVTFCATQKPGSDVVDTSLRDLLSIRWALRCTTPEASDTILGRGAAASGYSAKTIESEMRGAGYLWSEGASPVLVRADYYSDDQVNTLLERARELRAAAGTLPTGPASLPDQLRARGDEDDVLLAVLLDRFEAEGDSSGPAPWLPGSVLLDALAAAGISATPERLGALVVRTPEERTKRSWAGSRVSGYPRERVEATAAARLGHTGA